jgi:hypothetical protein
VNSVLRNRTVLGTSDNATNAVKRDLTLEKTTDICKAAEVATSHGKIYHTEPDTIHTVPEQKNLGSQSTRRSHREIRQDLANRQEK